jgi:hypothetical protein
LARLAIARIFGMKNTTIVLSILTVISSFEARADISAQVNTPVALTNYTKVYFVSNLNRKPSAGSNHIDLLLAKRTNGMMAFLLGTYTLATQPPGRRGDIVDGTHLRTPGTMLTSISCSSGQPATITISKSGSWTEVSTNYHTQYCFDGTGSCTPDTTGGAREAIQFYDDFSTPFAWYVVGRGMTVDGSFKNLEYTTHSAGVFCPGFGSSCTCL